MEDLVLGQATAIITLPSTVLPQENLSAIFARISDQADLDNYIETFSGSSDTVKNGEGFPQTSSIPVAVLNSENVGAPLSEVLNKEQSSAPNLVRMCCENIERRGLEVEVHFSFCEHTGYAYSAGHL